MKSNQDRPEKFDREIDAALKMLSKTAPPAAMVSRVHQSLEISVATSQQAKSGGRFWIPAGCTAVAGVLLILSLSIHFTREKQILSAESARMTKPNSMPTEVATYQPAQVPKNFIGRKISTLDIHKPFQRHTRSQYQHAANLLSYPLTRQEKLLVKFVQTAKPADLRDLNLEYQEKVEAQQEAEFAANMKVDNN